MTNSCCISNDVECFSGAYEDDSGLDGSIFSSKVEAVCRLDQQQDEKPTCAVCGILENLWICLTCGFVGCGRYENGHAMRHWRDTQHQYSMRLEKQQIWDYVGEKYVHQLNQSNVDGKSIMMNSRCISNDVECCSGAYEDDSGLDGSIFSSKVEAVCHLYQQQDEKPTCAICGTLESLWICLTCGFVGCGRYENGHAMRHWRDTQHQYSMQLEKQQIWDYVGEKYVHRLNQSKVDGKSIMTNSRCISNDVEYCTGAYVDDSGLDGSIFGSKVEATVDEYNRLLASQLEIQRQHYESLLAEAKSCKESTIASAVEKVVFSRMQNLQSKLESYAEKKKAVAERNQTQLPRSPIQTHIPFTGSGNGNEPINWRQYQVARCCVPILDRVITRYPATLSSFRAASDPCQSMFLEILAKVVNMLKQLTIGNLDAEGLSTAQRYLMDLKMSGIDMSWLEGRLNHMDGVFKKNMLVQRRDELAVELAEARDKLTLLEGQLTSTEVELEEIASRISTHPLDSGQSVIQGLL